jgi:hypothetical protein
MHDEVLFQFIRQDKHNSISVFLSAVDGYRKHLTMVDIIRYANIFFYFVYSRLKMFFENSHKER